MLDVVTAGDRAAASVAVIKPDVVIVDGGATEGHGPPGAARPHLEGYDGGEARPVSTPRAT